jgi:hypothetical protein
MLDRVLAVVRWGGGALVMSRESSNDDLIPCPARSFEFWKVRELNPSREGVAAALLQPAGNVKKRGNRRAMLRWQATSSLLTCSGAQNLAPKP